MLMCKPATVRENFEDAINEDIVARKSYMTWKIGSLYEPTVRQMKQRGGQFRLIDVARAISGEVATINQHPDGRLVFGEGDDLVARIEFVLEEGITWEQIKPLDQVA